MNNNEACAAYFKGNPAYRRCFLEFEKKWNSYGRAKGIITLKHTSEEERRAIGGILGSIFCQKNDNHAEDADGGRAQQGGIF